MSKQEFEPQRQESEEEVHEAQYPYTWSNEEQQKGMPRDEPHSGYSTRSGERSRYHLPWWARPQPRQNGNSLALAGFILLIALLLLVFGGLGVIGLILGSIAHILGVILGAILALFIFIFLFVIIIVSIVGRALGRAFGQTGRPDRRAQRRFWRN